MTLPSWDVVNKVWVWRKFKVSMANADVLDRPRPAGPRFRRAGNNIDHIMNTEYRFKIHF